MIVRIVVFTRFKIAAYALNHSCMATNPPKGDGHRNGAVRDRSQVYNPQNDKWTKRDLNNGQFMDQKANGTPFKGVRKEK